jgi:hypothetical protein
MRMAWWIALIGAAACAESAGGTAATATLPTVVSSPSKCIEQRDAAFAGATPDGLPVPRVSGSSEIRPDAETRSAIATYAVDRLAASFTVCIDATGAVQHVDVHQSSCFPRYDRQVADMMATWHFAPLTGAPSACGVVKFDYDQGDVRKPDGRH